MIFEQRVTIRRPIGEVWSFVVDIPAVSRCVPGVENIKEIGDNAYQGVLALRVGAVSVRIEGKVIVTLLDADSRQATLVATGNDRRVGGAVNANVSLKLVPLSVEETEMFVRTDAAILGKLGELGQAVIRRKADQLTAQFVANMSSAIAGPVATEAAAPVATKAAAPVAGSLGLWAHFRAWLAGLLGRRSIS